MRAQDSTNGAFAARHISFEETAEIETQVQQEGLRSLLATKNEISSADEVIGLKACTARQTVPVRMPLDPESLAALAATPTPKSCSRFRSSDILGGCQTDFNIEEGCCTQTCGAVVEIMEPSCWADFSAALCESGALRVVPFMEKITKRCHRIPQPTMCKPNQPSSSRKPKTNNKTKKRNKQSKGAKTKAPVQPEVQVQRCRTERECKEAAEILFGAAEGGDVNTVRQEYLKGVDIESKDANGWTPLIVASWKGQVDVVEFLLNEGADVEGKSDDGTTALIEAAYWGHPSVVQVLLDAGANVNRKGQLGAPALHWASLNGEGSAADLLIKAGAKVDVRDNDGATAMHWAAGVGEIDVVRLLINAGANRKAIDKKDQTIRDVVCEHGFCTVDAKFGIFDLLDKK